MEFPPILYDFSWTIISQVSLVIALYASDHVSVPLPKELQDYYKRLMLIPSCYSIIYAFTVRPLLMVQPSKTHGSVSETLQSYLDSLMYPLIVAFFYSLYLPQVWRWNDYEKALALFTMILGFFVFCFIISQRYRKGREMGDVWVGVLGPFTIHPCNTLCCALLTAFRVYPAYRYWCRNVTSNGQPADVVSIAVAPLVFSLIAIRLHLGISGLYELLRSDISSMLMKLVEIALNLLAYILALYFIQEKTIPMMIVLIACAVSWLGNIAMVQPSSDFGVFNFLVFGIIDCAMGLYGLTKWAWSVYVGCFILFALRYMVDNHVSLCYPTLRRGSGISDWQRLERRLLIQRSYTGKAKNLGGMVVCIVEEFLACYSLLSEEKENGQEDHGGSRTNKEILDKLGFYTLHLLKKKQGKFLGENESEKQEKDEEGYLRSQLCRSLLTNMKGGVKGIKEMIKEFKGVRVSSMYWSWCYNILSLSKKDQETGEAESAEDLIESLPAAAQG